MEPTVRLTDDQVGFFHTYGYLALEAITTQEEIARLRVIYDRMFARKAGRERGDQFDLAGVDEEGKAERLPQILGPSRYEPELVDTLYRVNAIAIAQQLYGPEARFGGDHAILKPAFHGAPTPWHQDEAYWDPGHDYNACSIWMPLQEATLENGCMTFIPGSHLLEVQPHHSINFDPRIHGLELDEVDASTAIYCPLPPGGCTIHHSRTMHYTPPNGSPNPRRAYILGLGAPGKARAKMRNFWWQTMKNTGRDQRAREAAAKANQVEKAPEI